MHAHCVEDKLERQVGGFLEHARAPELRPERESPLGRLETAAGVAHLKDANRRVETFDSDGETGICACQALAQGPRDEFLEALHCRRRRRDEPRDFLGGEQLAERRGIRGAQLAKDDLLSGQHRQAMTPVRAGDRYVEFHGVLEHLRIQVSSVRHPFHD